MSKPVSEIKIKEIMTTKIVAAHADDRVLDTARVMLLKDFEGIPVVDSNSKLLGMVTIKELLDSEGIYLPTLVELVGKLKILNPGDSQEVKEKLQETRNLRVLSIMNRNPHYLDESAGLEEAAEAFLLHHTDPLPVLSDTKELVGIVSKYDILKALTHPLDATELRTSLSMEREPDTVIQRLGDEFVVVSRNRARFWYVIGLIAMLIGILIAVAFIIRVQIY